MAMPGFLQQMRDTISPPSTKRAILGLFQDAESAATAGDALKEAGVPDTDYDFLTDSPYRKAPWASARKSTACTCIPLSARSWACPPAS